MTRLKVTKKDLHHQFWFQCLVLKISQTEEHPEFVVQVPGKEQDKPLERSRAISI